MKNLLKVDEGIAKRKKMLQSGDMIVSRIDFENRRNDGRAQKVRQPN